MTTRCVLYNMGAWVPWKPYHRILQSG